MSTTGRKKVNRQSPLKHTAGPPVLDQNRLEPRKLAEDIPAREVPIPRARGPPPGEDAFSLLEFCRRHAISLPFYYKLKAQGLGPVETRLGRRVVITKESAAAWRIARTADTAEALPEPECRPLRKTAKPSTAEVEA